jgi:hypothetical protein
MTEVLIIIATLVGVGYAFVLSRRAKYLYTATIQASQTAADAQLECVKLETRIKVLEDEFDTLMRITSSDTTTTTTTTQHSESERGSQAAFTKAPVPFVEWPCVCGTLFKLTQALEPGQAAVMNCDNCGTSYSVHLPPIQIHPTEKFEAVWPFTKHNKQEGT